MHISTLKKPLIILSSVLLCGSVYASAQVADLPSVSDCYQVVTLTPSTFASSPSIYMAGTVSTPIYLDLDGSGTLTKYTIPADGTSIDNFEVTPNKPISVYVDNEAQASKLRSFAIKGVKMKTMDASHLTDVGYFSVEGGNLKADKVVMPDSPHMHSLALVGNQFFEFPYAEKYPELTYLVLSHNNLTEFDASIVPNVENLVLSSNAIKSVKFNNPKMWNLQIDGNCLEDIDLNGLPAIEQIFLSGNLLSHIDLTPEMPLLRVLVLVANKFTFATLPTPFQLGINVYYYGNQAPLDVVCEDMVIDLSDQYEAGGATTSFYWFVGEPEIDYETGAVYGQFLSEGKDFVNDKGVFTFLKKPDGDIKCLMQNPVFPNLLLTTNLTPVSGVETLKADTNGNDIIYTIDGRIAGLNSNPDAFTSLPKGIYVVNGKKVVK